LIDTVLRLYATYERVCGEYGDVDEPEVNEEKDLLVEQIDRQDALDVVAVHGAQPTHLQVAHRDAREPDGSGGRGRTRRPIRADLDQPADDVDAVRVEGNAEEQVEQVQLGDDVDQVEALDSQVGQDQVVAAVSAARAEAGAS